MYANVTYIYVFLYTYCIFVEYIMFYWRVNMMPMLHISMYCIFSHCTTLWHVNAFLERNLPLINFPFHKMKGTALLNIEFI